MGPDVRKAADASNTFARGISGWVAALALAFASCATTSPHVAGDGGGGSALSYPAARQADLVTDYHGTLVPEPYRWMEEEGSPEISAWIDAENRLTQGWLSRTGLVKPLFDRLAALWSFERWTTPFRRGPYYFYFHNDGLQNQDVLLVQEGLSAKPRVLLDPNTLSEDGTVAVSGTSPSRDGKLLAYAVSVHGSDRQEWRLLDVATGDPLPDVIRWCKFSNLTWVPDGSGFYYDRFPEPGAVPKEDENNYSRVYRHELGTPQDQDRLLLERPDDKELGFGAYVTDDGRFLMVFVYRGTDPRNGLYYFALDEASHTDGKNLVRLLEPGEAMFSFIENEQDTFFVQTDLDAPRGRVVAIDLAHPERTAWKEVIPQRPDEVIESVVMAGNGLVVNLLKDAWFRMRVFDLSGMKRFDVPLPEMGSVSGMSARKEDEEMFFSFTSFLRAPEIRRVRLADGKSEPVFSPSVPFDTAPYETRQVFYASKDGTRIPLFLTVKKGLEPTGDTPVLLYGYGGFNINVTPYFSTMRLVFLEAGGILAQANLRGGSEYGEEWHQAGMLDRKQNVFDDFIAAARFLVDEGYTKPGKIAIMGGSNGGLLVSACMLQQPDLFGAVLDVVPVTDMLRYHKLTVGRYWVPEYGSADDPKQFPFLHAYSPVHNVKEGTDYPPALILTADTDDRVVPSHSFKFAAALQANPGQKRPILLRVETRAGHGAGKPTTKKIQEAADMFAFVFHLLGMELP
ncbi:MAG: S9 family peptidase [Deltaproteobacteria bacterium]|nr:S9 family peptidase [Deltaproteobacteria bacterium]